MTDAYRSASYGEVGFGFGERTAILVVDFQKAFTESKYPLGGFQHIHNAVDETAKLLEVARSKNIPVASCFSGYNSEKDMPYWKIGAVREQFFLDHPGMELDQKIFEPKYDFSFSKPAPSIFFNTPLVTFLTNLAGFPAHNSNLFIFVPGVTIAPAATKPYSSITELSSMTAPIPISAKLLILQAWIVALCPIVTLSPITVG
mgnify:CR=1 FL=1